MSTYDTCDEEVSRGGIVQPCDKTAVALRNDPEQFAAYPVCAFHARGDMVPLLDIVADRTRLEHAEAIIERARHVSIAGDGRSSVVLAAVREILSQYTSTDGSER